LRINCINLLTQRQEFIVTHRILSYSSRADAQASNDAGTGLADTLRCRIPAGNSWLPARSVQAQPCVRSNSRR